MACTPLSGRGARRRWMQDVERLRESIAVFATLRHPNVLRHYAMAQADDTINIFTEYVSGGSLDRLLKTFGPLPPGTVANYAGQVAAGLAYLHEHRIVHRCVSYGPRKRTWLSSRSNAITRIWGALCRDIKGANVLLDMTHGLVKLADFGAAAHISVRAALAPRPPAFARRPPSSWIVDPVPLRDDGASRCVAPTCSRRCKAR